MNYSQSNGYTWLLAILLAFAAGCGGSEEETPTTDEEGNASATSPQTADGLPKAGEPQGDLSEGGLFPRVEFVTTEGTFIVRLRRDLVPETVENFLRYVDGKFYDDTIFHEVTPNYAIVGGNFTESDGKMVEKPGLVAILNEAQHGLPNQRGTIAMARAPQDADSARCQFFFNLGDNASLDYAPPEDGVPLWQTAGYCAFGTVEEGGMAVLDAIAQKPVTSRNGMDRVPTVPIRIISARKL